MVGQYNPMLVPFACSLTINSKAYCMKRKVETVLIALSVLLVSCNTEREQYNPVAEEPVEWVRSVAVQFTLNDGVSALTRAVGDSIKTPALEREKRVWNLHAVVFNADDNSFYNTFEPWKVDSAGTYNFDMLKPGDYNIYFVANADTALANRLKTGVANPGELGSLLVAQTPGDDNQADHFLMTANPMPVTTVWGGLSDIGSVKLKRAAARFDFYNRVPLLRLTSITFNNRYAQSHLSTQASMAGLSPESRSYFLFSDSTGRDLIGSVYGYENMETPEAASFTLQGMYNDVPVKSHEIKFDPNMVVKRNNLYSIVVSPKGDSDTINVNDIFGSLTYDIKVNDWSEGALFKYEGDKLFDRSIPQFTVSGSGVFTDVEGETNPKTIYIASSAREITLTVKSISTSSVLKFKGSNNYGMTITGGEPYDLNGYMMQTYKIELPDDLPYNSTQEFELSNKMDKTKRQRFLVRARGTHTLRLSGFQASGTANGFTQYRSYSNYNVNSSTAYAYIDVKGYDSFKVYIRVINTESCCDHMQAVDPNGTTLESRSGSDSGWVLANFTGLNGEPKTITLRYTKDGSVHGGDDRGYFYFDPNQF